MRPGQGAGDGGGHRARRPSVDRDVVDHRCAVRHALLDAARVGSPPVGHFSVDCFGPALRDVQLLDEQLLVPGSGSDRRRAGVGRNSQTAQPPACAGGYLARTWPRHDGEQPAVRRIGFQHRSRGWACRVAERTEGCRRGDFCYGGCFCPQRVFSSSLPQATGYYYWRVTGSPFRMTYAVNRETYAVVPYFLFFSKRAVPEYHHAVMRDYYAGWEVSQFDEASHRFRLLARRTANKILQLWRFYLGPAFLLPLIAFPWILRERRMRLALVAGFGVLPGMAGGDLDLSPLCCTRHGIGVSGAGAVHAASAFVAAERSSHGEVPGTQRSGSVRGNDCSSPGWNRAQTLRSNLIGRWATWTAFTLLSD